MDNPIEILLPFSLSGGFHFTGLAGMSYHGGLTGMVLVTIYFCRRKGISFWRITDLIIPAIPLGYTFGRIGNFINGELYGKVTSRLWGMYFPLDPTGQLRHPSQLYEAFFEGVFLFAVLWSIRKRASLKGHFLALYLMGYGLVRFFIEFVREPDPQIGYIAGILTMGQILCSIMIAAGAALFLFRGRTYAS
jgi:phosphatidylglycerol:prolipoprotein diacylglycerol transferase